jgi:hypothetical protein
MLTDTKLKKLQMITFNDLVFKDDKQRGLSAAKVIFDNGYGASIVKGEHTYGGREGLYELAVLGKDGKLTYETPITDDVEGYLSEDNVTKLMEQIQNL